MTQKDKELLLRDLCARLPYGVKGVEANTLCSLNTVTHFKSIIKNIEYKIEYLGFKPYLLPLLSMTEEQKKDLTKFIARGIYGENIMYDWYNRNHFDYRGLIEKGLAINCTGLNIY